MWNWYDCMTEHIKYGGKKLFLLFIYWVSSSWHSTCVTDVSGVSSCCKYKTAQINSNDNYVIKDLLVSGPKCLREFWWTLLFITDMLLLPYWLIALINGISLTSTANIYCWLLWHVIAVCSLSAQTCHSSYVTVTYQPPSSLSQWSSSGIPLVHSDHWELAYSTN